MWTREGPCFLAHEEQRRREASWRGRWRRKSPPAHASTTSKNTSKYKMNESAHSRNVEKRKEGHFNSCLFFARRRRPYLARLAFGGLGRSTFSFGRQTVLARGADGRRGRVSGSRRREREREKRGHPSPRPKRARKTNGCNRTELMWWKGQIPLREELRK